MSGGILLAVWSHTPRDLHSNLSAAAELQPVLADSWPQQGALAARCSTSLPRRCIHRCIRRRGRLDQTQGASFVSSSQRRTRTLPQLLDGDRSLRSRAPESEADSAGTHPSASRLSVPLHVDGTHTLMRPFATPSPISFITAVMYHFLEKHFLVISLPLVFLSFLLLQPISAQTEPLQAATNETGLLSG